MTELKNSNSAFSVAMREVFKAGEKQEAMSANVLFAMIEMEATFSLEWLESFFKAENKVKTQIIEDALSELSVEFTELKEVADTKITDIRKETNAAKKDRMTVDKASAQAKVKAAQNMIRSVATALLYFRSISLDKINLTDRKRIRWSIKDEGWFNLTGLTFKELVEMGKAVAGEKNWIVIKKDDAPKTSSGAANEGESLASNAKMMNSKLADIVKTLTGVLKSKDFTKLSDDEQGSLRELEEALIVRTYGDEKGVVDTAMLCDMYTTEEKPSKKTKKAA